MPKCLHLNELCWILYSLTRLNSYTMLSLIGRSLQNVVPLFNSFISSTARKMLMWLARSCLPWNDRLENQTQACCHPAQSLGRVSPLGCIASYTVHEFGIGHIMHVFDLCKVLTAFMWKHLEAQGGKGHFVLVGVVQGKRLEGLECELGALVCSWQHPGGKLMCALLLNEGTVSNIH